MSFADAPKFLIGQEVRAKRAARSANVRVAAAMDATLFVPEGHWIFVEDGEAYELPDEPFHARFVAVPPDERSFVERGRAAGATPRGPLMLIEGRNSMPIQEFVRLAVRAGADGSPICRLSLPLWRQAELLIRRGESASPHLQAIRAEREAARAEVLFDPQRAAELHLLDAILDPMKDKVSDGIASIYAARPPEGLTVVEQDDRGTLMAVDPEGLRGVLLQRAGVPPVAVVDVTSSPFYVNESLRAFARTMLEPFLGDCALENAVVVPVPVSEIGDELREEIERWLDRDADLIVQGPPASSPNMPGYETSPMRHYRLRDANVELCTFGDPHGFYVYAWKADRPAPGFRGTFG